MGGPKHSRSCPRFLARASVVSEALFMMVFLVGPLGASVDSDGDGVPDVPIVVAASTPLAELSNRVLNLGSIDAYDAALHRPMLCPDRWDDHASQVHQATRHFGLHFLCLLRC